MRNPPAYQEYASTMLADTRYRLMSLAERGLLDTLRRECWCNGTLPADPAKLARLLSLDKSEVEQLLPAVMSFFSKTADGTIFCPELEDLRQIYAERREKQAEGARKSQANRRGREESDPASEASIPLRLPQGNLEATSKHPASSLQVCRPDQTKPDQSKAVSRKEVVPCPAFEEWMAETPASSERPGMVEVEI